LDLGVIGSRLFLKSIEAIIAPLRNVECSIAEGRQDGKVFNGVDHWESCVV